MPIRSTRFMVDAENPDVLEYVASVICWTETGSNENWEKYIDRARTAVQVYGACRALERGDILLSPRKDT